MKLHSAAILLALIALGPMSQVQGASTHQPEWQLLGASGSVTRYVDGNNTVRSGNDVLLWRLQDFSDSVAFGKTNDRSVRYQVEYDCGLQRRRSLYQEMYSGPMASGNLVSLNYTMDHWREVVNGAGMRLACGVFPGAENSVNHE
ncbi:surface-adhesin E family protein [Acidisoma sp. S159]|uniref:surface-adhesin E family protein n=1 Tax=Acidisoma sp. S159 TaxID=1747225 RepID=UPI00352BCCAF